jgi:hypothetical protein
MRPSAIRLGNGNGLQGASPTMQACQKLSGFSAFGLSTTAAPGGRGGFSGTPKVLCSPGSGLPPDQAM